MITRQKLRNIKSLASFNPISPSASDHKPKRNINSFSYSSYETVDSKNKAPPLLILHGVLGSKSNWNTLSKIYQKKTKPGRKIIALDARNHGESPHDPQHNYEAMSDDLLAFIKHLNIEKVSLLGHSMGGGTAMFFSLEHPQMVEKLIVCDFSPIANNIGDLKMYLEALEKVHVPEGTPLPSARTMAEYQLQKKGIKNRSVRKFLTTNLIQNLNGSYGWRINVTALKNSYLDLAKIRPKEGKVFGGPTLFVGGGESGYLKLEDFPKIKKLFPNSELTIIKGAGHWVHVDKRVEFAILTLKFLNDEK